MAEYFKKDGEDFVPVEDKLLAQDEVDKVVETRLERQKKQYADYDIAKEKAAKVDTIASEYEEKLKAKDTEIETYKGEVGKKELEVVKVKAIHEFKLSKEAADFVTGTTADEILKNAEKLSKVTKGGSYEIDKTPKPDEKTSDTKKVAQGLFGNKSDD